MSDDDWHKLQRQANTLEFWLFIGGLTLVIALCALIMLLHA